MLHNYYRCVAQLGRALRSGRRGRRFKSCRIDSLAGAPETFKFLVSGLFQSNCFTIIYRCVAQLGRALRSGRRGRRFKSCRIDSLQELLETLIKSRFPVFFMFGAGMQSSAACQIRHLLTWASLSVARFSYHFSCALLPQSHLNKYQKSQHFYSSLHNVPYKK